MKTTLFTITLVLFCAVSLEAQNDIVNTLGTTGTFSIKDGSSTFFSLSQSTGYVSLTNSLTLVNTTGSTLGVIYKGADRFIHDYQATSTDGNNTFVGVNSGNFTMAKTGSTLQASYNTGVGVQALNALTTGSNNSAFGNVSLNLNSTGSRNSAFGYQSLTVNVTGNNNAAFGWYSLGANTDNYNSAFGAYAGSNITSGSNNTCIGRNALASVATVTNEITLGDANIATLRCNVQTITSLSDARDKKNITDLSLGLDFLMTVRPRQFNWDRREWYEDGKSDGSKMKEQPTAGFIAQELDEAQTKENVEWLNLVLKSNPDRLEATAGNLLPIMVKAIQELKAENDALRASIAEQVKSEVKAVMLRAFQQDGATKVSMNETRN